MRKLRRLSGFAVLLPILAFASVANAATINVTSTADSGAACTLRNAITAANSNAAAGACAAGQAAPAVDKITFAAAVGPAITLTSALPQIGDPVTISGPGAAQLAVDGAGAYQPFKIGAVAVTISGLTVRNGKCGVACGSQGGAIHDGGTLTLDSDVVSNSLAQDATAGPGSNFAEGGGIEVQGGATLHVVNSTISGNTAAANASTAQNGASGGAIMDRGTVTIDSSRIAGNTVTATAGAGGSTNPDGGAITNDGHLTITRSSITGNLATGIGSSNSPSGGAISEFNDPAITLAIDRSTIADNTVSASSGSTSGGGIDVQGTPATIHSSTISGNSASTGANLIAFVPLTLSNSIVTSPQVGSNCASAVVSAGFNLESTDTCGFDQATDLPSTVPMLGALADNGGGTYTRVPLAGSPVIDAGKAASGEVLDQRGLLRPSDIDSIANAAGSDGSDIGAVEVQDTVAPDTSIDAGPAQGSITNDPPKFSFSSSESNSHFQCSVDGAAFAACTSPDTLTLADGSHSFSVRAVDGTLNADATPATRSFTLDRAAPQTKIKKLKKKKTTKRKIKLKFKSSEPGATFECRVDSKPFKACESPYKTKRLKPGKHKIQVRATDAAGNVDASPASAKVKVVRKR